MSPGAIRGGACGAICGAVLACALALGCHGQGTTGPDVLADESVPILQPLSQRIPVTVTSVPITEVSLTFDTGIR